MIAKKNSRYDLERKRSVLFQAGLLAAGSFTLAAFTYTSEVPSEFEKQVAGTDIFTSQMIYEETPVIEEHKPEPPQLNQNHEQNDANVGNSQAISEDVSSTDNTSTEVMPGLDLPDVGDPTGGNVVIVDEDPIDPFPPIDAQYVGGPVAMKEHLLSHLRYPEQELSIGKGGKVYLSFVVEKDGSVTNVEVVRGVTDNLDREAIRLVRSFPKWIPAENAYGKCRTRIGLPINFEAE